ncbi:hypothetical protein R6Q59_035117 [Mikania micrantha]
MTMMGCCVPSRDASDRFSDRCFNVFPCLSDPGLTPALTVMLCSLQEQSIAMIVTDVFYSLITIVFGWEHAWPGQSLSFLVCGGCDNDHSAIIIVNRVDFSSFLLLFHSYLVVTNQTTYELVRRRRIPYMRSIPERVYPFSKGACRNLYNFCFARRSIYAMEPLPSAQELEQMSVPYRCLDVISCRCCC